MKRREAAPTMKDVAREAGVALGTVSKVFNGIPVGDSYRERVEEAARRLGYQVNSYARGLKTNQTCMAALLLTEISDPLYAALAEEVCRCLGKRDYRMILALSHGDPAEEQRNIHLMERHSVDGIIGVNCGPRPDVGDRTPFVRVRDLDAAHCSLQSVPQLAEECVELLLGRAREGARVQICIEGVTLERDDGAGR